MKRPILIHPDPRLKKVCDAVPAVDDALREVIDDMFDTMYAAPGIGLAAPQIGLNARLLVMDIADREEGETGTPIAMANPEIVWQSETEVTRQEGCLSIPDIYADICRPEAVRVRFLDRDGGEVERAFEGMEATCVQHELDHLNGRLFIDYLGTMKRQLITQKMRKLKRERAREAG